MTCPWDKSKKIECPSPREHGACITCPLWDKAVKGKKVEK